MIFAPFLQAASNLPTDPSALESSISALESAISALEREIKALEICSAFWEPWVWLFSALVVIGVVMELWVIRHDSREEMEEWAIWHFIGVTRSPSKPSIRKLRVEYASVILISIGVAGELAIGVEISHINGLIRDKAGEVRTKNGALREKSDQLVALVSLEAKLAEDRTAKMQAAMMLRHLSKEQGDALCSAIPKSHANEVVVTSSSQDWESFRYAQDFNETLRHCTIAAGLEPSGGVGNSFWGQSVPFGVWIRYQKHLTLDDPRSPNLTINPVKRRALAETVRKALESLGVKVEGVSDDGRAMLDIYVGPRFPLEADAIEVNSSNQTTTH